MLGTRRAHVYCVRERGVMSNLPKWATAKNNGSLVIGAQLCTKDGRRLGNAHIVDITERMWKKESCLIYSVLTDAGTRLNLTSEEIASEFYPSEFISDVNEVLKKFCPQKRGELIDTYEESRKFLVEIYNDLAERCLGFRALEFKRLEV